MNSVDWHERWNHLKGKIKARLKALEPKKNNTPEDREAYLQCLYVLGDMNKMEQDEL